KGATMSAFTVTAIIDGDTFEVSPQWKWNGETGTRVRPTGYDAPELHAYGGQAAKDKLSNLILGKTVELGNAYRIDRGRLVCDVYYQGRNLADYFSAYQ
ncbi:MAG TPA: thermonuclease family protein, partial [Phycisphaerales bacterium]|nr:thermonuclease family protein [Phycisphaerales bacterium]